MTGDSPSRSTDAESRTTVDRLVARRTDPVLLAVAAIVLVGLAVRLVGLGTRVAHQDEARVAYWAYRYAESGVYWYRPVVHGPFLAIVNSHVFDLLGASDFTMRLVPALVGGLLPLSALLFRGRLRDSETVAMALLLAANPLLLYYSRFYRNDLLLAGFMLAALGLFVRAYDHRRPAFLYAGTAIFALAVTTKENALVYPVCWAGAAVLLWDRRLLVELARDGSADARAIGLVRERVGRIARGVYHWRTPFVIAVAEFLAIVVFFYAPRGEDAAVGPTLGQTIRDPTLLPALVGEATLGSWHRFTGKWVGGSDASYLDTAQALWPAYREGAIVVLALAVVGFLADRYSGESGEDTPGTPRDVVAFASFWGVASLLGYPVIVDNPFPWEPIHAVAPLVIPAAVGLALLARLGLESVADGDAISTTAAGVVLLVLTAQVGATAVSTSFADPQSADNELVQYAQSGSEMKPVLRNVREAAQSNEGIDVLYYGPEFYSTDESRYLTPRPDTYPTWHDRLPFAWYFEIYGAEVDSTTHPDVVGDIASGQSPPPVVVTLGAVETCEKSIANASDVAHHLPNYERHEVHRYLHDSGCIESSAVIFVEEDPESGER